MTAVVLQHARVLTHDGAVSRPLAFDGARVAEPAAGSVRIDLADHVIVPGLINAHDHLQLNAIPPLSRAEPFANSYDWIDAFEKHRQTEDVERAVAVPKHTRLLHGAIKNLLAGVTTVAHHDPWDERLAHSEFPLGVIRAYGWSHSLGLGTSRGTSPPRYGPDVRESFAATPHDHPWIIHLAEGTDDAAARELACLDTMGCLADNTVLVHGTGLTSDDVGRVIARGASVVWCPSSNLGMLGRTLDPRRLAEVGRLALGTDSRLTGSRDLLDELRIAATQSDLSPRELLGLVTTGAARVLRLPVPTFELGSVADCLILHAPEKPHDALLAARRADLRAVVRAGVPMIADPDFAHWFARCGVTTRAMTLDGRPKLMADWLVRADVVSLEPGLEYA